MKNLMTLLVFAAMVLASALGAKAQFDNAVIRKVAMTVNSQINDRLNTVGEVHVTEADLSPLKDSLGVRERFLKSYTNTQVLNGKISFYRPNGRLAEKDTVMTVCALNVRKLKGSSRYDGVVVGMFGFNPKYSVPVPHVLWDYTPNTVAQTTPQGGGQSTQQGGPQPGGAGKVGGLTPGQFLTDPNSGTTYVVIVDQAGNPSLIPVNAMVPAGMQTAQTTPQGGGQAGQKSVTAQQDSTTRSATWSQSLTTSGDQDLLAQMGTPGSQGGQQKAGTSTFGGDPNDPSSTAYWYREERGLDGSINRFKRDPYTGEWVKQEDMAGPSIEKMEIKPNDVLVNQQTGEVQLLDRRRERLRTNRGYGVGTDPYEDHLPTTASAATARFSNGNAPMGWFNGQMTTCPGTGFVLQNGCWVGGGGSVYQNGTGPIGWQGFQARQNNYFNYLRCR